MDEDLLLIAMPILAIGLNFGLWRLSRGYTRFAGAAMFVLLSGLIASPLIGVLCWQASQLERSFGNTQGDALVALAAGAFNAALALIGAVAAAVRKPVAPKQASNGERVRLRSD
ncbi:hypothetical protein AZ78_4989 [Lysobacter capsici AZ78]|uniref:Uncharacterized protein n=1 Tax=Lysobacter capsici AZ78 TaxID=1444315 RepID=A0A108U4C9_9GAMM|nr:hypothetical protein [Lysobacter capsici]KWS02322.1 hypothetical protein AZ78_4989 [Lysobacter capsici AZ78]WND78651.1 hypothetical protein RJ610_15185 [Lysobacter capsici]WND83846.1 hypothetical protein RJ609_15195 [Lysobacter capsici]